MTEHSYYSLLFNFLFLVLYINNWRPFSSFFYFEERSKHIIMWLCYCDFIYVYIYLVTRTFIWIYFLYVTNRRIARAIIVNLSWRSLYDKRNSIEERGIGERFHEENGKQKNITSCRKDWRQSTGCVQAFGFTLAYSKVKCLKGRCYLTDATEPVCYLVCSPLSSDKHNESFRNCKYQRFLLRYCIRSSWYELCKFFMKLCNEFVVRIIIQLVVIEKIRLVVIENIFNNGARVNCYNISEKIFYNINLWYLQYYKIL